MLYLRSYDPDDAQKIVSWIGDEVSFRQWCADRYEAYPISAEDVNRYYAPYADSDRFFPMTACDGTEPVGHLLLRFTNETRTALRFGFIIVDASKRGRGYGRNMLMLALQRAFSFPQVAKVTLGVFENNAPARACYRSVGFREAVCAPERYEILGEIWNCLEMELERV